VEGSGLLTLVPQNSLPPDICYLAHAASPPNRLTALEASATKLTLRGREDETGKESGMAKGWVCESSVSWICAVAPSCLRAGDVVLRREP
jgi:hypothetical protein